MSFAAQAAMTEEQLGMVLMVHNERARRQIEIANREPRTGMSLAEYVASTGGISGGD